MKELVDLLVKNLKVNESQATGGAAVLFKAARDKLGSGEFASLLGGMTDLDDLIRKAPEAGGASKLFGGFASALGGGNAALLATIVSSFSKLGLTPEHAKGFVPVMMEFLRKNVGKDTAAKLEKTLRAGL